MLNNYISILSTKNLHPTSIELAKMHNIEIICHDWVQTQPNNSEHFYKQMDRLNKYIVFTSSKAAKVYAQFVANLNPSQVERFVYCLAGHTLQVVNDIPSCKVVGTASNAKGLAKKIIGDSATRVVSFLASNIRREVLPAMLVQAGITVHEITAYFTKTIPITYNGYMEGCMFFSPSAVDAFFYSNTLPQQIPCFCIGTTTAEAVSAAVKNQIHISSFPSQQAMVETVINYFKTLSYVSN